MPVPTCASELFVEQQCAIVETELIMTIFLTTIMVAVIRQSSTLNRAVDVRNLLFCVQVLHKRRKKEPISFR